MRRSVEAGEAGAAASADDLAAARLSIQAAVPTDYLELRYIDVQRELFDNTIAAYTRALKLTQAQYRASVAGAHLERLFDRFYRVDAARQGNEQHRGHGLGLAIVKAVAVMHGGSVCATSRGGITTLGFSVPQSIPGYAPTNARARSKLDRGRVATIHRRQT